MTLPATRESMATLRPGQRVRYASPGNTAWELGWNMLCTVRCFGKDKKLVDDEGGEWHGDCPGATLELVGDGAGKGGGE